MLACVLTMLFVKIKRTITSYILNKIGKDSVCIVNGSR